MMTCDMKLFFYFIVNPTKKLPLFIVSGASCAGKSTACRVLFQKEVDYIVLESDLLWNKIYDTPEDNYREYRSRWMNVCANISQIGKPVVLCGCGVPDSFESVPERQLFTTVHYLAIVSESEVFEKRMREGRNVDDGNWIKSSLDFNEWLKKNADKTTPKMKLVDNTNLTPEETAEQIDIWIRERL